MENHYQIPIYYTYQEFETNYNSDFKQWLDLYPDGRELDFIAEVERKYSFFFTDIHERVSFMYYIVVHCYSHTKYLYSKNLEMEDFVSVLDSRLKSLIGHNPKILQKILSNFSEIESLVYDNLLERSELDEYNIEFYDIDKYKNFFFIKNYGNNFDLAFDYVKFKNFELSVNRIYDELECKKELLKNNTTKSEISIQNKKNTATNYINDVKPNLLDRYNLANKVFGMDNIISKLDISAGEKHKLLSIILDCNIDNAKKLLNNKSGTKAHDFSDYYESLKLDNLKKG